MMTISDWLIKSIMIFHRLIIFLFKNFSGNIIELNAFVCFFTTGSISLSSLMGFVFFPLLLFHSFCLQSQMVHVLSLFFPLSSIGFFAKETAVQLSVYKGDCPKLLYRLM